MGSSIAIKSVDAAYGAVRVLEEVSLDVKAGETVVLLGTNGNGKSTLMKCIMGIVRPRAGSIVAEIDGERHDLAASPPSRSSTSVSRWCRKGAACSPSSRWRKTSRSAPSAARRAAQMQRNLDFCFECFPVLRERARQLAGSMSGGEQQMLALGRALMLAPKILLVDEPSVGLAPILVSRTIDKIKELKDRYQLTVLMAEQNFNQAIRIADRGYVIVHGKIAFEGGSADELNNNDLIRKFYLGL